MTKAISRLAALGLLAAPAIAAANIFPELSFEEKMAEADIVIIGTVTAITPKVRDRYDATATVSVSVSLKGPPQALQIIRTQSRNPEADPACCEVGSTYVMFLARTVDGSSLVSVNGPYGIVRIGPAQRTPLLTSVKRSKERDR
jgi:hypothetical protein